VHFPTILSRKPTTCYWRLPSGLLAGMPPKPAAWPDAVSDLERWVPAAAGKLYHGWIAAFLYGTLPEKKSRRKRNADDEDAPEPASQVESEVVPGSLQKSSVQPAALQKRTRASRREGAAERQD